MYGGTHGRMGGQMDDMEFHEGSVKGSNRDETYALHRFFLSFLLERRCDACRPSRDVG